ncbi:hypothetical protein ACTWPT_57195 [Nonomuraea sp. 3N208]|uniref:hypothetical protein n=1 Tax=Nonomuraea sp. 3N208 TaxID=3457421 RepID=UPI003FD2E26A
MIAGLDLALIQGHSLNIALLTSGEVALIFWLPISGRRLITEPEAAEHAEPPPERTAQS